MEFIFVLAFMGFIAYSLFTKKGRRSFLQGTMGEILEDYGDINSVKLNSLVKQTLHLYKCSKEGKEYFVIEVRDNSILSFHISYIKISQEAAEKMVRVMQTK